MGHTVATNIAYISLSISVVQDIWCLSSVNSAVDNSPR